MPFITDAPTLRDILVRLDEADAPPRIAPGRGAPLPLLRCARAHDRIPGVSVASSTVSSWPARRVATDRCSRGPTGRLGRLRKFGAVSSRHRMDTERCWPSADVGYVCSTLNPVVGAAAGVAAQ